MVDRCANDVAGNYVTSIYEFTGTSVADGVWCYFGDTMGFGMFALLWFGFAGIAIYEFSESVVLPIVIGLLVSVIVLPLVPGIGFSFFHSALVLIIVGVTLIMLRRMDRSTN